MAGTNVCLVDRIRVAENAEMTSGAVIFAVGDSALDYRSMASWSAGRIQRWLGLPTTLITDQDVTDPAFDQVIKINSKSSDRSRWFADLGDSTPWHNLDRCDVFELSPYDRTLLLDADYVICSNSLRPVIDHDRFWCFRHAIAAGGSHSWQTFGRHRHPQYWATVMAFSRNTQSQFVFDSMRMIRDSWQHYRDLFHVDSPLYRNDYALSMALPLVNGHIHPVIPAVASMINVLPEHSLQQEDADRFLVEYGSIDQRRRCTLQNQDFHAMCKRELEAIVATH
jgi:hypothetical protein